jgi:hypothetical protein
MTEPPTDHRFQAEKWLEQARDIWNDMHPNVDPEVDRFDVTACALIGIGHALLANLGSNRPYDFETTEETADA